MEQQPDKASAVDEALLAIVRERLTNPQKGVKVSLEDLAHEAWQAEQIEAALSEADAGDFVPEMEMAAKFSRWGINAG